MNLKLKGEKHIHLNPNGTWYDCIVLSVPELKYQLKKYGWVEKGQVTSMILTEFYLADINIWLFIIAPTRYTIDLSKVLQENLESIIIYDINTIKDPGDLQEFYYNENDIFYKYKYIKNKFKYQQNILKHKDYLLELLEHVEDYKKKNNIKDIVYDTEEQSDEESEESSDY